MSESERGTGTKLYPVSQFGSALNDLVKWALANGYTADEIRKRVERALGERGV